MSVIGRLSRALGLGGSRLRRRSFEAGAGGRRWDGFIPAHAPDQSALAARGPARARAAALSANNPIAARIVECWTANLIGSGWQAQSQHPDETTRRADNAEFERLVRPVLPVAARALVRDGEAFIRISADLEDGGDGAVALSVLPADQVDPSLTRDLGDGARILQGIELDAADRVVAYHVLPIPPGAQHGFAGPPVRVPASEMMHIFDPVFPGQVRGLSWMAPVLLKLRDFDEASDAQLMALKTQSMITGFVRDLEGGTGGFERTQTGAALDVSLEPGAMRFLPPNTDVTFSRPGDGLSQATEFTRGQLREIAAGVGLTYEQLTGDLSGANYSSARVGLLEFRRRCEMLQKTLIEDQLLRPLWARWQRLRALLGEIEPADLDARLPVRFVAPGWRWVDPAKEVAAEREAVAAGFKSRAEVVAGRGRDLNELDAEIAADTFAPAAAPVPPGAPPAEAEARQ